MAVDFAAALASGQVGEGRIAQWLLARGWNVLPVYETELDTGKGPRLYTPDRPVIATDMFIFRADSALWIEAKTKTRFTWYRIAEQWETGIDLRHYLDYLRVDDATPWDVWLMFLHTCCDPDPRDLLHGCPRECPTGLFARRLSTLRRCESHRSDRHGSSGMVYWAAHDLTPLADLWEV